MADYSVPVELDESLVFAFDAAFVAAQSRPDVPEAAVATRVLGLALLGSVGLLSEVGSVIEFGHASGLFGALGVLADSGCVWLSPEVRAQVFASTRVG